MTQIKSKKKFKKPELLAPAGSFEKMKTAFEFGADAVYFGIPDFSLRARVNQFGKKEIQKAAEYCREKGKKFYVTLNIYAHERHFEKLSSHLDFLKKIQPDGVIVSDPGIFAALKKKLPAVPIIISTQANVTNSWAVKFWQDLGVRRIILARELTLPEIGQIRDRAPKMELEIFIHGAMCMAYSGRCLLSKWMNNRSANLGDCTQPCRWKYNIIPDEKTQDVNPAELKKKTKTEPTQSSMTLVDNQARFEVELQEDRHGTYFFNSFDLCLIDQLDQLIGLGLESFKIEGRSKSVYYVAIVCRAYRRAIDETLRYLAGEISRAQWKKEIQAQKAELEKLTSRGLGTGFLLGQEPPHLFSKDCLASDWEFVGISKDEAQNIRKPKTRKVLVHNALRAGDAVEIIQAAGNLRAKIVSIKNQDGDSVDSAHGGQNRIFEINFSKEISGTFLIRKSVEF